MSVSKIAPLAGRGNYKEWSIDMTQFFTAKFMRELLTGKAGNLPEEHEDFAYLETLKTIGAQTIKESVSAKIGSTLSTFQQPPQPEKMWSALASEYGTDNVFYVQKYVNQWRKLSRAKYSDPHELVNMHKKCIDEVSFIKTKCGLSPERAEEVGSIKLVRVTVLRT
ncbi:hypothetical protein N7461_001711 [Penicillium sp. DV-2018c]|nr:hypothetical protein N7461_001711 [Penicillium sp. DV-2018c]